MQPSGGSVQTWMTGPQIETLVAATHRELRGVCSHLEATRTRARERVLDNSGGVLRFNCWCSSWLGCSSTACPMQYSFQGAEQRRSEAKLLNSTSLGKLSSMACAQTCAPTIWPWYPPGVKRNRWCTLVSQSPAKARPCSLCAAQTATRSWIRSLLIPRVTSPAGCGVSELWRCVSYVEGNLETLEPQRHRAQHTLANDLYTNHWMNQWLYTLST
jgi:hypothetical protein